MSEVAVFVVVFAGFPAAEHDALPFEGEGADSSVIADASFSQHGAVGLSPAARDEGAASMLVKGLAKVEWTGAAFFDDAGFAALDSHGSDAAELLHIDR